MTEEQIEVTLAITQAMADELTDYLMGDTLYHQLVVKTAAGTKQPKMTVGALLENLEDLRWAARQGQLTSQQQKTLKAIEDKIDLARGAFANQWADKLRHELNGLLSSWRWYLQDVARNPEARENYASEARKRTRIALVMQALAGDAEAREQRQELAQLDQDLRETLEPGGYVGPRDQENRYGQSQAWWLHGRPAAEPD